jgi:uncharacterized protein YgbK (DUF1537 family)
VSGQPTLAYGWYGDDLTGATDTLATISRRGQRAFLFLSVPTKAQLAAAGPLTALGIAGGARTMSPRAMQASLPRIATFFRERGVRLLHYKCCSTFDSAPGVGNLAVAIEAFRPAVEYPVVPIVGGQPSLGRYCTFSNLFAAAGDQVFRIDRHPTMSRHPSTPMHEADLTRHFAALGLPGVGAVHWPSVTEPGLIGAWRAAADAPAVLLDVLDDRQLRAIGGLLRQLGDAASTLVVGASSVAEAYFGDLDAAYTASSEMDDGPVLALIGSLSPVTRAQVAAARSYHFVAAAPDALREGSSRRATVIDDALAALGQGRNVMVSTAPRDGDAPGAAVPWLAEASAALIDEILGRSRARRLAIAGGDTSTAAVTSLGFWGLSYHSLASRGVAICRGRSDDAARDGMLILLKGGQMGPADLFDSFANTNQTATAEPATAGN